MKRTLAAFISAISLVLALNGYGDFQDSEDPGPTSTITDHS